MQNSIAWRAGPSANGGYKLIAAATCARANVQEKKY